MYYHVQQALIGAINQCVWTTLMLDLKRGKHESLNAANLPCEGTVEENALQ